MERREFLEKLRMAQAVARKQADLLAELVLFAESQKAVTWRLLCTGPAETILVTLPFGSTPAEIRKAAEAQRGRPVGCIEEIAIVEDER